MFSVLFMRFVASASQMCVRDSVFQSLL